MAKKQSKRALQVEARRNQALVMNPVARAMHRAQALSLLKELQIELYLQEDGSDGSVLLGNASWVIACGAELALRSGDNRLRRLHGALRTIMQLCLDGYVWRTSFVPMIDQAVTDSHDLIVRNERLLIDAMPGANYVAARVRSRSVDGTEVAGAEIYREAA
jgi:hypothetical protein